MNIAETIRHNLHDMTRSERQVALYYLAHAEEFAFNTLEGIARLVDTSTTSVLRFCRRLGFGGFKELQQALRQQLRFQPELPDKFRRTVKNSESDELLDRTVTQDIRCIQDTFQAIPTEHLQQTVAQISGARRVYTFGMKESYALAHYTYTRLLTVRPDVHLLDELFSGELEKLLELTQQDLVIAFLFHRYTRQSLQLLELLKQRDVPIVLVTNEPCTKVKPLTQILLPCGVDYGGIKNTAVAPVVLSDYLCSAVAVAMGEDSLQYMKQTEALLRTAFVLGE